MPTYRNKTDKRVIIGGLTFNPNEIKTTESYLIDKDGNAELISDAPLTFNPVLYDYTLSGLQDQVYDIDLRYGVFIAQVVIIEPKTTSLEAYRNDLSNIPPLLMDIGKVYEMSNKSYQIKILKLKFLLDGDVRITVIKNEPGGPITN